MKRNWFITGANRGLGRAVAEAALRAGHDVVATARRPQDLDEMLAVHDGDERFSVLPLDVRDHEAVEAAVAAAAALPGGLDVVLNNAGYGLAGAVEELSEDEIRLQMEVNFFGALWVTKAAIPHLRERQRGHFLQVTSIGGLMAAPNLSIYHASKWALEAMSESLAGEVARFGIKVTIVEPGALRTDWARGSMVRATRMAVYDDVLGQIREALDESNRPPETGDPALAARALVDAIEEPNLPLRLLLGNGAFDTAVKVYESRLASFAEIEEIARSIDVTVASDTA